MANNTANHNNFNNNSNNYMPKMNEIQKSTSPSRSQLLKDKEARLQKALDASPKDKELINRGRSLDLQIQENKARRIEANKARGTQSSAVRTLVK